MKVSSICFSQNCKFIQSHTRNRPFCFCIKSPGSKIYFMESRSRGICNRCVQHFMGKYKILCFPSMQSDRSQHIKNQARRCIWGHDHPLVEQTVFVPNDGLTSPGFPCNSSTKHPSITIQSRSATSTPSENETAGSSFISKSLRHPNIPPEITDVILELQRPTTTSRYESVLRRWYSFAISRNENPYSPDVTAVLAFLHGMYRYGCLYSGLCAARSALSSSITAKGYLKLSDHPLISKYLKGLYNRHLHCQNMWIFGI